MATREELKDPDFIPFEGELRYVARPDGSLHGNRVLQQYQSRHGWHDVPTLTEDEIPTGDATANARNA